VVYTYDLIPAEPATKSSEPEKPRLTALYGLLADVYRELGGGEKYLRNEREQLRFIDESGNGKAKKGKG
jgi:hypothetical protein